MADDHINFDKAAVICGKDTSNGNTRLVLLSALGEVLIGPGATPLLIEGDQAVGVADSNNNNPVRVGGTGNAAEPTVGTEGARVGASFDLYGRLRTRTALEPTSRFGLTFVAANFGAGTITAIGTGAQAVSVYDIEANNGNLHDLYLKFWSKATTPDPATDTPLAIWLVPRGSVNSGGLGFGARDRGGFEKSMSYGLRLVLGGWYQLTTRPDMAATGAFEDTSDSATITLGYTV